MTFAIYVRLSKDVEASTSVARQVEDCEQHARNLGLAGDFVVFEDVDVSGFKDVSRPGRDELMRRLPEFSHLIVWKLDRLARSVTDSSQIIDRCLKEGVALVSVKEGIDLSTPMGKMMAQMASIFAEMESANIGTRVASARSYLSKQGFFSGGRVPFGYRVEKDQNHHRLVPEPSEVARIEQMIEKVLSGETARAVARWLDAEGVPSRLGRSWTGPSVKTLLTGRVITGHTMSQGHLVTGDDGLPIETHPPIIDMATHKRLCDVFEARKTTRTRPNGTAASSPLHGVVFCHCGRQMSFAKADKRGSMAYKCSCGVKIGSKKLEACVIPAVVIGMREATAVFDRQEPVEDDFDAKIADLAESLSSGRISLEVFEQTAAVLERKRPKEVKEVKTEHLFERWNDLTSAERAVEMRRIVKVHVRPNPKEILIEPLVDGLKEPWYTEINGESVVVNVFDRWLDPAKWDMHLMMPDHSVAHPALGM